MTVFNELDRFAEDYQESDPLPAEVMTRLVAGWRAMGTDLATCESEIHRVIDVLTCFRAALARANIGKHV